MGSADLMPRNLRRRIELLFPVDDAGIRAELDRIVQTALDDRRKGRRLIGANRYSRTLGMEKYENTRSQTALYRFYRERFLKYRESKSPGKGKLIVYEGEQKNQN